PADIKQGTYIGVAGMPQADGSQKALEVHIFPESMRGVGDGHRGWDLQASSTMTNGNVEATAAASDGQTVTLKYKDGEKKIAIPAGIPVVLYVPGELGELKPGAKIFVSAANKQPHGTLQVRGGGAPGALTQCAPCRAGPPPPAGPCCCWLARRPPSRPPPLQSSSPTAG